MGGGGAGTTSSTTWVGVDFLLLGDLGRGDLERPDVGREPPAFFAVPAIVTGKALSVGWFEV
jgi:hypothetical protein